MSELVGVVSPSSRPHVGYGWICFNRAELLQQGGNVHGLVSDLHHLAVHQRREQGRVHPRQKQIESRRIPQDGSPGGPAPPPRPSKSRGSTGTDRGAFPRRTIRSAVSEALTDAQGARDPETSGKERPQLGHARPQALLARGGPPMLGSTSQGRVTMTARQDRSRLDSPENPCPGRSLRTMGPWPSADIRGQPRSPRVGRPFPSTPMYRNGRPAASS